MLTDFFEWHSVLRRLRAGCTGAHVDGFADALVEAGYSPRTIRGYLRAVAHFGRWADGVGMSLAEVSEAELPRFVRHLRTRRRFKRGKGRLGDAERGVRVFIEHLRRVGLIAPPPAAADAPRCPVVASFRAWMERHRGLTSVTLDVYERALRPFFAAIGTDPDAYDVARLRSFVIDHAKPLGVSRARLLVTALRSLLRFLAVEGRCPPGLDRAVPAVPQYRLSSLPRYLEAAVVAQVLASCDTTKPAGLRDRAVLLLLARLGLRAGDIVAMRFDDIDWRAATLLVRGKGRRDVLLPLPQDVGNALLAYLRRGRPRVDLDKVFITARPPYHSLVYSAAVSNIVGDALQRAGVRSAASHGAHLMRHSAATAMLRAGCTLETIAKVLRHRSVETTAHYAKVDLTLLQSITQPWPEGLSC